MIVFLNMSVRHDWEKQIAVRYSSVIWFINVMIDTEIEIAITEVSWAIN